MRRQNGFRLFASMIVTALIFASPLSAQTAKDLIAKAENILRGKRTLQYTMIMKVERPRWDREMKILGWDDRDKKSTFMRILSPPRDAGTAFLKQGGVFRQYIPRIRRTMRISKSMMTRSWMGSDYSNDDLARESSWTEDYTHSKPEKQTCDGKTCYKVIMTAKPGAPVVWPKMEGVILESGVPYSFSYFNKRGEELKRMTFDDMRNVNGSPFPFKWIMENLKNEGHRTIITFEEMKREAPIPASIFTERNLKKGE